MAVVTSYKKWSVGEGFATFVYNGNGDGTISVSSSPNEGIDRQMTVNVGNYLIRKSFLLEQKGKRELFMTSDGQQFNVTSGAFQVLK